MKSGTTHEIHRENNGIRIVFHPENHTPEASAKNGEPPGPEKSSALLKSVTAESLENGLRIVVNVGSPLPDYRSFTIQDPSRVVYDISGCVLEKDKETVIPLNSPRAQAIRYFSTHAGIRLVIETENRLLSAFSARTDASGLIIETAGSVPGDHQVIPARILRIGFSAVDDGTVACAVEATKPMAYDVHRSDGNRISLTLYDTILPEHLSDVGFRTALISISSPVVHRQKGTVVIPVLRKRPAAFMAEQSGSTLVLRMEAALESGEPPAAKNGEKTMDNRCSRFR